MMVVKAENMSVLRKNNSLSIIKERQTTSNSNVLHKKSMTKELLKKVSLLGDHAYVPISANPSVRKSTKLQLNNTQMAEPWFEKYNSRKDYVSNNQKSKKKKGGKKTEVQTPVPDEKNFLENTLSFERGQIFNDVHPPNNLMT